MRTSALHIAKRKAWKPPSVRFLRHLSSLPTPQTIEDEKDLRPKRYNSLPDHSNKPNGLSKFIVKSTSSPTHEGTSPEVKQERINSKRETEPTPEKEQDTAVHDTTQSSPSHATYTGGVKKPITSFLHIVRPQNGLPHGTWPLFRIMDENGQFRDPAFDGFAHDYTAFDTDSKITPSEGAKSPVSDTDKIHDLASLRESLKLQYPYHSDEIEQNALLHPASKPFPDTASTNTLLRAHRQMIRLRQMDNILQNAQRQGRISFYMSCRGEEAIHIGSAAALKPQDTVFAQYREAGLLMWRGFTLEQFTNQCFSNDGDLGRGRQMPVHYGSRALNYHTISSPLGTQLPHAAGAAYKLKLDAMKTGDPHNVEKGSVAVAFFGDGCASTTDFHSACNFAATLEAPLILFCRNNGYAISTPITEQYAGDGIVARAPGYGMAAIRIDGNDIFAVSAAVRAARAYAIEHFEPVMIEAMTYRQGHHSTSDDSTRYRSIDEVQDFVNRADPVKRLNAFLERQNWMTTSDFQGIRDEERMNVMKAMKEAEQRPPPKLEYLFEDVYSDMPPHLQRQQKQLMDHMAKYPGKY